MEKKQELESGDCEEVLGSLELDICLNVADALSFGTHPGVLQKKSDVHRVVTGAVPNMDMNICFATEEHPWK